MRILATVLLLLLPTMAGAYPLPPSGASPVYQCKTEVVNGKTYTTCFVTWKKDEPNKASD